MYLHKDNSFFKKLEKFKKNKALILENGIFVNYEQLLFYSKNISKKLIKKKKLIFLLGQNNLETISGYVSFVNRNYSIILLDFKINDIFLKNLISIYQPTYIFCEKSKIKNKNLYKLILKFKSYNLYQIKKEIDYFLNPNLMLLMSTSGSTGSPKLVRQSYKNVSSNTKQIVKYLNITKEDITITSLPISYVYGLSVINTHLFVGATIVLTNSSMVEKKFWDLVKNLKVNNLSGVPYSYSIIEKISRNGLPPTLKYTTQAGGKMNDILIKKIIAIYKKQKIKLIQMYGAAEATSRMSYLKWRYAEKKIGSIGKAIPGGSFYLVDNNGRKILKNFKKGELVYSGKNVYMGYAECQKDLSVSDLNNGLLNTGDIAYRDEDNFYYIVGRKNRYVKVYGARIDLSELESILSKKGIDTIMKAGDENKIYIYFKDSSKIIEGIKYLSKVTLINSKVFMSKILTKKNLTNNLKYKV